MGMNIKNETVERLARQLADQTGETLTAAIQVALEERLDRVHRERDIAERKRRVREIVESFGPVPEGMTSDHSDLYDEHGLPK
ncbi:type II toxin-antitoxin system VapB family antitoxin [Aminobacter sp. HY435]|uniref:type II toxin-antitoxin system VapB family antitoxin n=1 Tax=Aminobacter sp. HY435 TaxID=2970917 RepID=UPI0022B9768B|nr:type II toxin-antitoxin system VapB family antitoxin [Aminobacter sp. HY435]